jgi:hypothetical protein
VPPSNSWNSIEKELSELLQDQEYKWLKPILENIKSALSAKKWNENTLEIVSGLLDVVKQIHKSKCNGENPKKLVMEAGYGLIQPNWDISGDIYQATGDIHYSVFINNINEINKSLTNPSIVLPIVLAVMNASEAKELAYGDVLNKYDEEVNTDFRNLQKLLEEKYTKEWVKNYKEKFENWIPFTKDEKTIEQLIEEIIQVVGESYKHQITPWFIGKDSGAYRSPC